MFDVIFSTPVMALAHGMQRMHLQALAAEMISSDSRLKMSTIAGLIRRLHLVKSYENQYPNTLFGETDPVPTVVPGDAGAGRLQDLARA
ncbi:hypothetical protein HS961_22885 [Comamonas piscis]|uniref:Uncharacterized protein n=1 Tax=Comamonas piscis TaxID=1562974 RepID=A0A7G5EN72_9BURK|nr:hypothetical protein [Comamonas piscis]QMV75447.1 hypothetical protein HS961_22885 [Comamonas piscis]WSO33953.1 hypothetical protein VUJ63_22950 [Comamonas piscis]